MTERASAKRNPRRFRARLACAGGRCALAAAIALSATVPAGVAAANPRAAIAESAPAADARVRELRDLPLPLRALPLGITANKAASRPLPPLELRRQRVYDELHALGPASVLALARALRDPDPGMRRNVAVTLDVLGGGWWHFPDGRPVLDLRPALPALTRALRDPDAGVRAWAAQDLGDMRGAAAAAVPGLRAMLRRADAESRGSACRALGRIGAPARVALPQLRMALDDPAPAVRQAAREAIAAVERAAAGR